MYKLLTSYMLSQATLSDLPKSGSHTAQLPFSVLVPFNCVEVHPVITQIHWILNDYNGRKVLPFIGTCIALWPPASPIDTIDYVTGIGNAIAYALLVMICIMATFVATALFHSFLSQEGCTVAKKASRA